MHRYPTPSPSPSARSTRSTAVPVKRTTSRLSPASSTRRPKPNTSLPPSHRKPRPAWNTYLTDDQQYKLTREEQLVRQMQQLSAAHFHTRGSPARRRLMDDEHEEPYEPSSPLSLVSSRQSYTSASTSLVESRPPASREQLQGELLVLERMLSDLEHETERLDEYEAQSMAEHGDGDADDEDEVNDHDTASDETLFDDPVAKICYQSLRVGLHLTHQMQRLTQELDNERQQRKHQDERIRQLEERCMATEARNDEIETRYHDLASHVDAMREAMIATEEALHRVTQDLQRSREPISFTTYFGDHPTAHEHRYAPPSEAQKHEDRNAAWHAPHESMTQI